MPLSDFLLALDTIEPKSENLMVVLTGGEPLMRKDIEQCGREIRKHGARWGMVTNGYLYNQDKHNALINAGMGALTISLDGLEINHNWLRNNNNSFARTDSAIALARGSTRLNFDVVTCVNARNIDEIPLIYNYLLSQSVKAWRLFTIVPIGRAANSPDLVLTNQQFKYLLDFISHTRKLKTIDIKFSCEGYVGPYESKVRDTGFFCRAGINIGSVLIDGSISACPNIDRSFVQGNIYTDNFFEVWNTKFQVFRDRKWTKTGRCANCNQYADCQGNGMHNWYGDKANVLVCHNEKINPAG
jgi:radical SAM enzyme (rSAM/lipoprotein system)